MIGSMLQNCLLLNFIKVSRKNKDSNLEEEELLNRKRGVKYIQVIVMKINEDNISEKLFFVSEYEASYAYINPYIEFIKRKMYDWSGNLLRICQKN